MGYIAIEELSDNSSGRLSCAAAQSSSQSVLYRMSGYFVSNGQRALLWLAVMVIAKSGHYIYLGKT